MNIPADLKYSKDHEWVRVEDGVAVVGITDYAQKELGDIVFVEPVDEGTQVEAEKEMTTIESVKAASDIFAPVSGTAKEFNSALEDAPETVNKDPYGEGWILKIGMADASAAEGLMSAEEYTKMVEEGGE